MSRLKLLRAIAKALGTLAGPAGFPAEFAVSILDDTQAEGRHKEILDELESGDQKLEVVLAQLRDLDDRLSAVLDVMSAVAGMVDTRCEKGAFETVTDEDVLAAEILSRIRVDQEAVEEAGLITDDMLFQEFLDCWEPDWEHQGPRLRNLLRRTPFPVHRIGAFNRPPDIVLQEILNVFGARDMAPKAKCATAQALAGSKRGSVIIQKWANQRCAAEAAAELARNRSSC